MIIPFDLKKTFVSVRYHYISREIDSEKYARDSGLETMFLTGNYISFFLRSHIPKHDNTI